MIKFNLKWWMDTNRFVQGIPIHPPDPNVFLYTDASHFGWGAQIESMNLSFHGHWSQDQSQLHINMLEKMAIRFALNKKFYTPFLCHDFYRQHNSGLLYQQARRNPFSQPLCRGMEDPPMMAKTTYSRLDSSYPRQIQCFEQTDYREWIKLSKQNGHWINRSRI